MSLLELFYHVDVFCQSFLPEWNQQLRAWTARPTPTGTASDERTDDHRHLFPSHAVSHLQDLVSRLCAGPSAP